MSVLGALVLGILIGWLVEWIIDWVYWRKKANQLSIEAESTPKKAVDLDQTAAYNALVKENAELKDKLAQLMNVPDDLKIIDGIGPEIERRLHNAGIKTFAQLAELTPEKMENILGDVVRRLSNEQYLIDQARELAKKQK